MPVGTIYLIPESGWKREEVTLTNQYFSFTTGASIQNHSSYSGGNRIAWNRSNNNSGYDFIFYGSNLRIISSTYSTYSNLININIDGIDYSYTLASETAKNRECVFEISLQLGNHTVSARKINQGSYSVDNIIDAIDIESTAIMGWYEPPPPSANKNFIYIM